MTGPPHFPSWTETGYRTAEFSVVETRLPPGCVTLTVVGDVDLLSRERFAAALRGQPVAAARKVTVDLSGVAFCDARGAGELITLRERALRRNIPVQLVVTAAPVRRCLEVLGLATSDYRSLS